MLHLWRAVPLTLLSVGLSGCIDFADFGDSQRYKEDFHLNFPLTAGGTLSIDNSNGSVEIIGWEQNTVDVNGTKFASTKGGLDDVKIDASASNSSAVRLRTIRPMDGHGNSGAQYRIRVPRKVMLDSIVTTNGGIRVEDIDGTARLRSTNGAIRIQKLHGDVEAKTTNGSVEARGVEGNANLYTTNGSIQADVARGSFEARTSNGSINAAVTDATANWPVKDHSTNGSIDLRIEGSRLPDVRAETTNSSVTLHLPQNASARVRAHTAHSRVTSDFEVTRSGSFSKSDLEGTIGSGGPTLELSSTNGSIKLLKL